MLYVIMLAGDNESKVSKLAILRNKLSKKACWHVLDSQSDLHKGTEYADEQGPIYKSLLCNNATNWADCHLCNTNNKFDKLQHVNCPIQMSHLLLGKLRHVYLLFNTRY